MFGFHRHKGRGNGRPSHEDRGMRSWGRGLRSGRGCGLRGFPDDFDVQTIERTSQETMRETMDPRPTERASRATLDLRPTERAAWRPLNAAGSDALPGHCPQCDKHCPLDDPGCGKGKAFAARLAAGKVAR